MSDLLSQRQIVVGLGVASAAAVAYCTWVKTRRNRHLPEFPPLESSGASTHGGRVAISASEKSIGAAQTSNSVVMPAFSEASRNIVADVQRLNFSSTVFEDESHGAFIGPFKIDLGPVASSREKRREGFMGGHDIPISGQSKLGHLRCSVDECFLQEQGDSNDPTEILVLRDVNGSPVCTCTPGETRGRIGMTKIVKICGEKHEWGTLKFDGMSRDNVLWHSVTPVANKEVSRNPMIHIGQVQRRFEACDRGNLQVCLWDPAAEGLPRRPPDLGRIAELSVAEGSIMDDILTVHLAPSVEDNSCRVLLIALVLSVNVFHDWLRLKPF